MQEQLSRSVVRIPLAEVDSFALVDPRDAHLADWAWRLHTDGYAVRYERSGRSVYLHREVLGLRSGDGLQCDHINRDRLDCRRANLRVVTNAQNSQNRPKRSGNYRGAYFHPKRQKWIARVKLDYQPYWLGFYDSELDAAKAAEAFRRKHTPFATYDSTLDPIPACSCIGCRPSRVTDDQLREVIAAGATSREVAEMFGIAQDTARRWMRGRPRGTPRPQTKRAA
jgi:hypothetical protein